jgi:D-tyrosyl-tRNA(Tyr) deacylase
MRALVQRVLNASVDAEVDGTTIRAGEIDKGLLVLLGITHTDTEGTAKKMAEKIWNLRIMEDENGVMNISIADSSKSILLISQFTLYGDTNAGRRPTWTAAAKPEYAEPLVNKVVAELQKLGAQVETGRFRTYMQVSSVNDGPTTVSIEI